MKTRLVIWALALFIGSLLVACGTDASDAPSCTSTIVGIRVVGDHTGHGPIVYAPEGCKA